MINLLALAPSRKISLEMFSCENKATTTAAEQIFANFPFVMRAHAHIRINFGNEVFYIQFHLFHCSIDLLETGNIAFIGTFAEKNRRNFH